MVAVAVKVALEPGQMVLPGLTLMLTVGVVLVTTEMVNVLLVTKVGVAQVALLVSSQVITSPFARPLSL